jgi:serine O-acetyltransferase
MPSSADSTREPHAPEPFWSALLADFDRWEVYFDRLSVRGRVRMYIVSQGLWALAAYRFARWVSTHRLGVVRRLLWPIYRFWEAHVAEVTGITLDPGARISPGLYIGHFGSIFVGPGVVIGRNCSIGQMCVISSAAQDGEGGTPVIGERVYVAAAAKVIGNVSIGSGAVIGAGAVCLSDVPENGVAVGNPAVVVNLNGSADFIRLRGSQASEASAAPE